MKNPVVFIAATLESIELIKSYTAGYHLDDFLADRKTQDAVIRNLEMRDPFGSHVPFGSQK